MPGPRSYRTGAGAKVLSSIARESVNIAVWRRSLPPELSRVLDAFSVVAAERVELVGEVSSLDLWSLLQGIELPAARWLVRDISKLIGRFAQAAGVHRLRVSFGPVRTDQCRKFHVDFIRLRLLTTYLGPGTEWLPNDAAQRSILDAPPECPVEANRQIVLDPARIQQASAGDVLLLKGELFGGVRGAVHRSPPIEAQGVTRIVLALSTLADAQ
jgi:Protein of unknown function (DUF1826)